MQVAVGSIVGGFSLLALEHQELLTVRWRDLVVWVVADLHRSLVHIVLTRSSN